MNRNVGNEYVKVLSIKNITTKTQKIKYVLPSSKIFLLDFPQTITLCAGMSASIPITFIPEEKVLLLPLFFFNIMKIFYYLFDDIKTFSTISSIYNNNFNQ